MLLLSRMECTTVHKNIFDGETSSLHRKRASRRVCFVSGFSTELLEVESEEPSMNVLVIPGNPGIVSFYIDFVEALYEHLEGCAFITAIGHVSHSKEDMACGRRFSLQEQIDHKMAFIRELQNKHLPIILVGHSIGSYICMKLHRRLPEQVVYSIFLYPFLTLNTNSLRQYMIGVLSRSTVLSATLSCLVALLGFLPIAISRVLVSKLLSPSWSTTAVDSACNCFMKYHTMRNVLFMAMTEFEKLSEELDWEFIKTNKKKIAFLFGDDDHWGPLSLYKELSRQVSGVTMSIEREGHSHAFCCGEVGSIWVARYVASLIRGRVTIWE